MMHENLLKHYFDQEGPKGDLSPKQWETVLNHVKTHTSRPTSEGGLLGNDWYRPHT